MAKPKTKQKKSDDVVSPCKECTGTNWNLVADISEPHGFNTMLYQCMACKRVIRSTPAHLRTGEPI